MNNNNLEDVIADSLTDAASDPVETETASDNTPVAEVTENAPEAVLEAPEAISETEPEDSTLEVASPASKVDSSAVQDEFAKRHGLPAQRPGERENRIPYSRVKSIVAKAEKEAKDVAFKEYEPKLQEATTKLSQYEGTLQEVAKFEQVMTTDRDKFLGMLSQVPIYKDFFDQYRQLVEFYQNAQTPAAGTQAAATGQPAEGDGKPQPNEQLADGSWVYSEDQLDRLMEWRERQVEARITKQIEDRYKPIETQWQAQQAQVQQQKYMNETVIPQIQKQIDEARTWPMFKEHEEDITKILQSNPNASLEGAYRQVVFPKMTADRDKMRQELLKELQTAPVAPTSAPASRTRPTTAPQAGPRSLEEIIAEAVQTLK